MDKHLYNGGICGSTKSVKGAGYLWYEDKFLNRQFSQIIAYQNPSKPFADYWKYAYV